VDTWKTENHAGVEALSNSNWAQAQEHLEKARATAQQWGPKNVRLAGTLLNLAAAYEGQGKLDEAAGAAKEAVTTFEAGAGAGHQATGTAMIMLAKVYKRQGKPGEAVTYLEKSIAIMDRNGTGQTGDAKTVLAEYAECLEKSGRAADAKLVQARVNKLNH
jgi:tetratricopeptide (TPR) repeat protein